MGFQKPSRPSGNAVLERSLKSEVAFRASSGPHALTEMMRFALAVLTVLLTASIQAGPSRGYTSTTIYGNQESEDDLPSSFYEPLAPATRTTTSTTTAVRTINPTAPRMRTTTPSQQVVVAPV